MIRSAFYVISVVAVSLSRLSAVDIESAPIHYSDSTPTDRFAVLKEKIEADEFKLSTVRREALLQVLEQLEVPIESQVLVFSKTSAQNSLIGPSHPRAIYFSDNCYVGWAKGGSIEILTYDPKLGAVFYVVDPTKQTSAERFDRPASCLNCHERSSTGGIPGGLVRSVFAQQDGMPLFHAGSTYVDQSTPVMERWGGWYVTGTVGDQTHLGNAIASESEEKVSMEPVQDSHLALEQLDQVFDTRQYPAKGSSDVVALMIFEHQIAMHNTLSAANLSVRQLQYRTAEMRSAMGEPPLIVPEGTLKRVIESQATRIVEGLLFRDEHQMEGDGVEGSDEFADAFSRNRKPTADGRSLKDLRLYERLFKYRCSYVIYSEVFDHLTPWLKQEVYRQLSATLSGDSLEELSSHMSLTERDRILGILKATKHDWPSSE
ncbi:MAG: hypothetical protein AAGH89_12225 [Verrucomicrobiota bacterium]